MTISHDSARNEVARDSLMTRKEVAAYLNCSLRALDAWAANGKIGFIKLGGKKAVRFRREDVDAFLERFCVKPKAVRK